MKIQNYNTNDRRGWTFTLLHLNYLRNTVDQYYQNLFLDNINLATARCNIIF